MWRLLQNLIKNSKLSIRKTRKGWHVSIEGLAALLVVAALVYFHSHT
jgi:hypothetical protein